MNRLVFSKMQGLGNDFMVIDAINQTVMLTPKKIQDWSDRHTGVGFDQLMMITPPPNASVDFGYRIFNRDGNEVEQCGNGVRCVARFIAEKQLSSKKKLKLASPYVTVVCELQADLQIRVNMGRANFAPDSLPFLTPSQQKIYKLPFQLESLSFGAVATPNPHVILQVTDVYQVDLPNIGLFFNHHPAFPKGTNVGLMQLINARHIQLRVFERGAGETLACGTNACAAMVVGQLWGLLEREVRVSLLGGDLWITLGEDNEILMTGPAVTIFEGQID